MAIKNIENKIVIMIALAILLTAGSAGVATQIDSCTTINSPGEYVLNQNMGNFAADTCINIASSDVVLDGAGYTVGNIAAPGTYGVYVNNPITTLTNVTVKNLKLSYWNYSIYYNNVMNGRIDNNTVSSNYYAGIYLISSSGNVLINNTVQSNSREGIYLRFSDSALIGNNTVSSNAGNGILLQYSNNSTIYNNIFNNKNNFKQENNSINKWNTTKIPGINIMRGPYLGGNFWANPNSTGFSQTCTDFNKDGICDSKYMLDSNNTDYLPLTYKPDTVPPRSVTNLINKSYAQTFINWIWTDPVDYDFLRVIVYLDGRFRANVSRGVKSYNTTGLLPNTSHTISTRTVDIFGNINQTWVNRTAWTMRDNIPPKSITNLTNKTYAQNYINWTWTDPADYDLLRVILYLDGRFRTNISKGVKFYNTTGLLPNTSHTIAIRTVDTSGNINQTWVNRTAWTARDNILPRSITNLTNKTYAQNYINWTWTDPADYDFLRVIVYLDGRFRTNISKGIRFYNATGLLPNTSHTIAIRTVDTSGNINQTWMNRTARTAP